jgi:transcriptional regulator with XRE-family HTH domain
MAAEYLEASWHIGDVIRKLRQESGLKLKQVAERAGINLSVIHKLEMRHTKEPERATLQKLAAVFGLTVRQLEDMVPASSIRWHIDPQSSTEVYLRPVPPAKPTPRKKHGAGPFRNGGGQAHDKKKTRAPKARARRIA